MLAPRVNAAGRMSTPDIATRLLLATDEAMVDEARGLAQQLNDENLSRQQEEAELVAAGEEGDRNRPGDRRAQRARRRRRRLASRRHRHRRVEAGRRVPQAGHRAVDRRRRGARLLPQHPRLRHARRARALRGPVPQVRRPQAGGRPDDGGRPGAGVPRPHQRLRRRSARARSAAAAAAHRRRAESQAITHDLVSGLDAMGPFGLANPRPVFHAMPRRDRRRPAHAQGHAT